jgi:hypothetical protein
MTCLAVALRWLSNGCAWPRSGRGAIRQFRCSRATAKQPPSNRKATGEPLQGDRQTPKNKRGRHLPVPTPSPNFLFRCFGGYFRSCRGSRNCLWRTLDRSLLGSSLCRSLRSLRTIASVAPVAAISAPVAAIISLATVATISIASATKVASLRTSLGNHERQKSHLASSSDRLGDHSLLLRGVAGLSARKNLATIVDEPAKDIDFLVVDGVDLVGSQIADFAATLWPCARFAWHRAGVFVAGACWSITLWSVWSLVGHVGVNNPLCGTKSLAQSGMGPEDDI